jgi:hypothetical protein
MSAHVLNGAFYSLSYDLLNDFAPIAPLTKAALVMVGRWFPPQREHRKCEPNYAPSKVRWIISLDPRPD